MAAPSVTHTFTNGTTADATQVNTNFSDIISALTDGTKDLTFSALTANGATTLNGTVTLGNATSDDITFTGRIASDFDPKTANANDLGDATQLWRYLYCYNVLAEKNATGDPTYSFHGDTGTGLWSSAANTLNFSTGGAERLEIDAASIDATVPIIVPLGSVGVPSIAFSGDTDTGMWSSSANLLNFSLGGAEVLELGSTTSAFVTNNFNIGNSSGTNTTVKIDSQGDSRLDFTNDTANAEYIIRNSKSLGALLIDGNSGSNQKVILRKGTTNRVSWDFSAASNVTQTIEAGAGDSRLDFTNSTANKEFIIRNSNSLGAMLFDAGSATSGRFEWRDGTTTEIRFDVDAGPTAEKNGTLAWVALASDTRLKTNQKLFEPMLDKVCALKPKTWDWKTGKTKSGSGFVAQDIAEIFPDALRERDALEEEKKYTGDKKYTFELDLVPILVKSIQELTARLEKLEN